MSEEKSIPEEKSENVNEHFPEDSHAPQTINDKQETTNMEVHKHPLHITHKKKWGEYLLEFLMLFLAVFLGFLAEYQLEHVIEHKREKQFVQSIIEDLKTDTAAINQHIILRHKKWNNRTR